jgi:ribulose-5-phosphate 4-epimerase/fuculose-1-phosphate aldolase
MPVLSRRSLVVQTALASAALAVEKALAQQPRPQASEAGRPAQLLEDLVAANKILVDQGVLDGYGHVSVRSPADPERFWMSRSLAPELVTAADLFEHDFDGNLRDAPADVKPFLERFIHGGIYRARPDVKAVVHNHAHSLIPFAVTGVPLRPLYHMSAFLGSGAPVFDIRAAAGSTDMLVRTPSLGNALAKALGPHQIVLMRGHGAAVVGPDLPHAVFRSVYAELNARLQGQAMALGRKVTYLDAEEARLAQATMEGTLARPWELWRKKALAK